MHELSIVMSIIEMAEEEAERHGGARVEAVHLKLGVLSGVVRSALESCYEMACEHTVLEGSRLLIEEAPLVIDCARCGPRPAVSVQQVACSECGLPSHSVLQGRELQVVALELTQ